MNASRIESLDACPDLFALHASNPERYPFLLESTGGGASPHARWDILFASPGPRIWLDSERQVHGHGSGRFLDALDDAWLGTGGRAASGTELPFTGGWFIYLGYELATEIEPRLGFLPDMDSGLPVAFAVRIPVAVVVDRHAGLSWLVAEPDAETGLAMVRADIVAMKASAPLGDAGDDAIVRGMVTPAREPYLDAVRHAKRYIHDGDVYQANLAHAWRGQLLPGIEPHDVHRRLRERNGAPFSGIARWSRSVSILSASPERLVRTQGRRVETRPIAGTRPRGGDTKEDLALTDELLAHPKERAEHVMLVDLERNDLGKLCTPGTVEVNEMMVIESYPSVHHIVSNIRGELRDGVTPGQVIAAVFPGGTITGCPKVRCMEIIAELESAPRGAYTGSFGYLDRCGDMDLNILIRTLVIEDRHLSLKAGAGIVADSDPDREFDETLHKARGMLRALHVEVL